jgi:hypothetical protein
LSEFRTRLVEGKLELVFLDVLLNRVQGLGLLKQRGKLLTGRPMFWQQSAP